MTIKEFILEKLKSWGVDYSEALISEQLKDEKDKEYSSKQEGIVDNVFYNIIPDLLLLPSNISEGGYSVSYNRQNLMMMYKMIAKRLGKPVLINDSSIGIRDISNKW